MRHVLVPTDDLAASSRFFSELLGLDKVKEPPTGYAFKMAWFGRGGQEVHVVTRDPGVTEMSKSDFNGTMQPHIAFEVEDMDEAIRVFEAEGCWMYRPRDEGVLSRSQLLVRDPSGMVIELYKDRSSEQ